MGASAIQLKNGEVVVPANAFGILTIEGTPAIITQDDFKQIIAQMRQGYGLGTIADRFAEDGRPELSFSVLSYFLVIARKIHNDEEVDVPTPIWMDTVFMQVELADELIWDKMLEKQRLAGIEGDRGAVGFLARQTKRLVGLPEEISPDKKPKHSSKSRHPIKAKTMQNMEDAIESARLLLTKDETTPVVEHNEPKKEPAQEPEEDIF